MPGPRKDPIQLKVLRGTVTRNAQRNGSGNVSSPSPLPALTYAPRAPAWMKNIEAVKEWNHITPILVAHGLLHEANITALAHACALHGQLVASWAAGETPSAALLAAYRALANSLCMLDFPARPAATGPNRFSLEYLDQMP